MLPNQVSMREKQSPREQEESSLDLFSSAPFSVILRSTIFPLCTQSCHFSRDGNDYYLMILGESKKKHFKL